MVEKSGLTWNGPKIRSKLLRAAQAELQDTAERAAKLARVDHPGYKDVTGKASRSIKVQTPAKITKRGAFVEWGSKGVSYFLGLEFFRGSPLSSAAAKTYKGLGRRIGKRMKRLK